AGPHRFLQRLWRLAERIDEAPPTGISDPELERARHEAIQRVTRDLDRFKFNTAVSSLMEFINVLSRAVEERSASKLACEQALETLVQLLHPFAPHLTEELWERRGHAESLLESDWPVWDESRLRRARLTVVVQVDGKLRDRLEVDADASERDHREAALASPKVREHLGEREVARVVVVPGRLVNVVSRGAAS
ncbi:MAG TPA: class I tRNA ligase family protein, partial [Thermoanaerobaculia bacterium]|nr:class I tRNA ligase family protein [Thermoanaerobaculia bacterium]